MLHQLSYISAAAPSFDLADMPELLRKARQKNRANGLTGLLLFANGTFLQVLEGPETAINRCYRKIERDQRHCWLVQLRYEAISERVFEDWSMGWHACQPGDEISGLVRNIASVDHLNRITEGKSPDLDRLFATFARRKFNVAA